MIWAKEETMSRAEIEAIQLRRLKDTVNRVYELSLIHISKSYEAVSNTDFKKSRFGTPEG